MFVLYLEKDIRSEGLFKVTRIFIDRNRLDSKTSVCTDRVKLIKPQPMFSINVNYVHGSFVP